MDIKSIILKHIENVKTQRKPLKINWEGGIYEEILSLPIDERGQVGEGLCAEILEMNGCKVKYDPNKTNVEKGWDLISDGMKIEVKFATIGKTNPTFQHENLHPQRDFNGVIFIDIAPDDIYLTCLAKNEIEWKKLHHRKESGAYKFDWNVKKVIGNKIETTEDFYNKYSEMVNKIKKQ